jgi:hypothetical protein
MKLCVWLAEDVMLGLSASGFGLPQFRIEFSVGK